MAEVATAADEVWKCDYRKEVSRLNAMGEKNNLQLQQRMSRKAYSHTEGEPLEYYKLHCAEVLLT